MRRKMAREADQRIMPVSMDAHWKLVTVKAAVNSPLKSTNSRSPAEK
jgi:hypothetical protein